MPMYPAPYPYPTAAFCSYALTCHHHLSPFEHPRFSGKRRFRVATACGEVSRILGNLVLGVLKLLSFEATSKWLIVMRRMLVFFAKAVEFACSRGK